MYTYKDYPPALCEDLVRLRRRLDRSGVPPRRSDDNLLIATWNIRRLGGVHPEWTENSGSPKRNLRSLACLAEVIRRFDIVAVQEILRDTTALRMLVDDFLGPSWGLVLSDVSGGDKGNTERLGYIYDRRRVAPSGLAGEIVLPPLGDLQPLEQFDRTPYVVGFRAGGERFSLLTVHIRYGARPADRLQEIARFAEYTAREIRDRARFDGAEETNLIVLGDFNIEARRLDDPLYAAFLKTGLMVPEALRDVQTNYAQDAKHYDQLAWFMGELKLLTKQNAGVVDFRGALYRELSGAAVTHRISDHLPLWVEFSIDRSTEQIIETLGLDAQTPDPFDAVAD